MLKEINTLVEILEERNMKLLELKLQLLQKQLEDIKKAHDEEEIIKE